MVLKRPLLTLQICKALTIQAAAVSVLLSPENRVNAMIWRFAVLVLLLAVTSHAATTDGTNINVYEYDPAVTEMVDVDKFVNTGAVTFLDGLGEMCEAEKGPAPQPYPQIRILGPCFEHLGDTGEGVDGVSFFLRGNHPYWKKNRWVFAVWNIRIPSANERSPVDFEEDLTLSMWVDWDQSGVWDLDELAVRKTVNVGHYLPTDKEDIYLHYLTAFRILDLSRTASMNPRSGKDREIELTYLWVRGLLSYDNKFVSPDGDQLYGEFEDYRVGYRSNPITGRGNGHNN